MISEYFYALAQERGLGFFVVVFFTLSSVPFTLLPSHSSFKLLLHREDREEIIWGFILFP